MYALLYCEGFDVWPMYAETLDQFFLKDPENEEYLALEKMIPKEAVLHSLAVMGREKWDVNSFGRVLVKSLGLIYENTELELFSKKMCSLWNKLPMSISMEEPFWPLSYAFEYLPHDEKGCRQLREKVLHYYD